jgi:hypothetical protein
MLDPLALAALISSIIMGFCSLIVSLFVGFKSGHFKCKMGNWCSVEMDDDKCEESK